LIDSLTDRYHRRAIRQRGEIYMSLSNLSSAATIYASINQWRNSPHRDVLSVILYT